MSEKAETDKRLKAECLRDSDTLSRKMVKPAETRLEILPGP